MVSLDMVSKACMVARMGIHMAVAAMVVSKACMVVSMLSQVWQVVVMGKIQWVARSASYKVAMAVAMVSNLAASINLAASPDNNLAASMELQCQVTRVTVGVAVAMAQPLHQMHTTTISEISEEEETLLVGRKASDMMHTETLGMNEDLQVQRVSEKGPFSWTF